MCLSLLAYCKLLQERYCNGRFIAIMKLLCIQDARSDCLQTVLLQRMSAVKMDLSVSVITFRLLDILFARHTLILRQIIVFLKHTFQCIFSFIGFFFKSFVAFLHIASFGTILVSPCQFQSPNRHFRTLTSACYS